MKFEKYPLLSLTLILFTSTILLTGCAENPKTASAAADVGPTDAASTGKILNTTTNHAMHHEKMRGNYGLYFNVWDRLMGTNHAEYEERFDRAHGDMHAAAAAGRVSQATHT